MKTRFGSANYLYDTWRQKTLASIKIPASSDVVIASFVEPVFGLPDAMKREDQLCGHIALYVLPPRSPKLNGRVERLNGTCRREFWEWYDGELDLPILQAALWEFETYYIPNVSIRRLGTVLRLKPSHSHMYRTSTNVDE